MGQVAMSYPNALEILPLERPPKVTIQVPGSKSIANRALVLAALSDPERGSELRGVPRGEDVEIVVNALRDLGFEVRADWEAGVVCVRRGVSASPIPRAEADIFVGNS